MKALPFAEPLPTSPLAAWQQALVGATQTSSERYLTRLARRAFLTLWSYPNTFTDEGRSKGKGDGKELCDLLVVFGNDILIFSDKKCEFIPHANVNVAWARWYRRAVEKSVKQLVGAKAWVMRHSDRIYLDRQCQHRLPLGLPSLEQSRIHLIAVARGSAEHAVKYWESVAAQLVEDNDQLLGGGPTRSAGSLMIRTEINGIDHRTTPFQIGWPAGKRQMVHVFDEETLDVVLSELDTISDFVSYLRKKEELLQREGTDFVIPGEEDLLAMYLSAAISGSASPGFPTTPPNAAVVLREGAWDEMKASKHYRNRVKANRPSYNWDTLIEFQTSHILAGTALMLEGPTSTKQQEAVLRRMAEEPRATRRELGAALDRARRSKKKGARYTSTLLVGQGRTRAYVVMTLARPQEMPYEAYQEHRRYQLQTYCEGCKLMAPHLSEVLGIAMEPYATETISVDFLLLTVRDENLVQEFSQDLRRRLDAEGMWRHDAMKLSHVSLSEFPAGPPRRGKFWRKS
ncbi:hypothetical protein J7E70_32440 [Variovorax paradoxus]|nr:hypothetical protein [Variovorax paradoxus]MBT2305118.1 hypothetical protein [Variovorax paradoxus]